MPVYVCHNCSDTYEVPIEFAGKTLRCEGCKAANRVSCDTVANVSPKRTTQHQSASTRQAPRTQIQPQLPPAGGPKKLNHAVLAGIVLAGAGAILLWMASSPVTKAW